MRFWPEGTYDYQVGSKHSSKALERLTGFSLLALNASTNRPLPKVVFVDDNEWRAASAGRGPCWHEPFCNGLRLVLVAREPGPTKRLD